MFGVIICPHCTLVQGADLRMARITCPRCGGKIDVKRAKVYFSTDSPKELAEGVRQVGARLVYDIEMPGASRPAVPAPPVGIPADEQSMRALVLELSTGDMEFTKDDVRRARPTADEAAIDRLMARMLLSGIIYESVPGRYRPA
jgi:Mrp family chromosome partitioning ATPase